MIYRLIFVALIYGADLFHSSYGASYSKFVFLSVNGSVLTSTLTQNGNHVSLLVINLTTVDNENFILDLHLNVQLLSSNYRERVIGDSGVYYRQFNQSHDHCYYIGEVRGHPGSSAALSTCGQISGYFMVNNKSYSIEPVSNSKYQLATVQLTPDKQNNFICGLNGAVATLTKLSKRSTSLSSLPSMKDRRVRIIEMYVASDMLHYTLLGSVDASSTRIKSIVNAANALYNAVDIYIVLVGSEVWTTQVINVDSNSSVTINNWSTYKANYLDSNVTDYDNAILISGKNFASSVVGLGYLGSMCHSIMSVSIVKDTGMESVGFSAAVLTHETGHNLGLIHDGSTCTCTDSACIMKSSISAYLPPTKFSSCSINDLSNNWAKGHDLCLWNVPEMSISPNCGNGVVEDGEACDCGGLPSNLCNTTCCNAATCQLTSSYQCASGLCCDLSICQIYQANTLCRDSDNTCDLPELCDGVSPYCPDNTYKHDGTPCAVNGVSAYCSEGKCRTRDTQCSFVWGSGVMSSTDSCYSRNTFGNKTGNCERTLELKPKHFPCAPSDIFCGQLFCAAGYKVDGPQLEYDFWDFRENCYYAVLNFGTEIPDPAYVPNGVVCGNNMMCYNKTCVDVSQVQTRNSCATNCSNGDGVCNNKGMCQCLNGLSYPGCQGSVITFSTTATTTTTTTIPPMQFNIANFNKNFSIHILFICLFSFVLVLLIS